MPADPRISSKHAILDDGPGGLPRLRLCGQGGSADVMLDGAHVTSFTPAGGRETLFLSDLARFERGGSIRGGIPVVFPWFGPPPDGIDGDVHGFARRSRWDLEFVNDDGPDVHARLKLADSPRTRELWPPSFAASYDVRLTADGGLTTTFVCRNAGDADLTYEILLHHYLAVADVRRVKLLGFDGQPYWSKIDDAHDTQRGEPTIDGEIDRVYQQTAPIDVVDEQGGRTLRLHKSNSSNTVLWNPHVAKAKRMDDFGDDEWPRMLCVEAANVGDRAITLRPGEHHDTGVKLEVLDA